MSEEADRQKYDVSRETFDRLTQYVELVRKWNPRINLVSRRSLDVIWERHIADSVQVFNLSEPVDKWVDLGSGGGFPGMVCAILGREKMPSASFICIESDQRKVAFLRTVVRECDVQCQVIAQRIEQVEPQEADVLSARALTDLSGLLGFAERHLKTSGTALFPKGEAWKKEVDDARKQWKFDLVPVTSLTEPQAVVLKLKGIARV
ncbi:16S rRNA (guanine(527)-N(7))-methyltransferase RsmG [Ruegeria aquimaris]|uniref:Ribosomal RNA small subunit methyltransferase G n=1 Tax=Ruegeria aquimaris TaxID=2984333 RepID=A0ABT3AMF0_9RHOB|nr:16S rRNA (guanine(527)-N(7))-methyltransferase RsmG [Ruegeria sp. XHP0148]MCV2889834.1 16S rRNA (guanine(527)-N(7))-methyltransferase RsmG [Ruegeria sp. XHP0148]